MSIEQKPTVTRADVNKHVPASVGSRVSSEWTGKFIVCSCSADQYDDGPFMPAKDFPAHVLANLGIDVVD